MKPTPIQPKPFFPPGVLEDMLDALRDVRPWALVPKAPSVAIVVSYAKDVRYSSPSTEGR